MDNEVKSGSGNHEVLITVVVPVFNEDKIISEFHKRLMASLKTLTRNYLSQVIYVNDGSSDQSEAILTELQKQDRTVQFLNLSRNFGHQIAITAGIDHAQGDAVIVIDGDLQDPPELIPTLISKWEEGYDVVFAIRKKRKGESPFKLATAYLFYRLLSKLSETKIPLDTGDFRLMDKQVVNALKQLREGNRYIRGLISWIGFNQTGVPYERDRRYAGTAKYSTLKSLKLALDGITSFSDLPLALAGRVGALTIIFSMLLFVWIILGKLLHPENSVQGWTSIIALILLIGGVQMCWIGVLGQYIGRTYKESQKRPLYFIKNANLKTNLNRKHTTS